MTTQKGIVRQMDGAQKLGVWFAENDVTYEAANELWNIIEEIYKGKEGK